TTDFSIARIGNGFAIPPGVNGATPQFVSPPTPANGATLNVQAGNTLTFTVEASENSGAPVSLGVNGLPAGTTQSPPLPTSGNPLMSTFSCTPATLDLHAPLPTLTTDFNIAHIVNAIPTPPGVNAATPQFVSPPTPPNGATLTVQAGNTLTFTVEASENSDAP